MKNILHFAILFLLPFQLLSKDDYSIGDTLYVWSDNGLKLREAPGFKTKALGILYACDQVIVSEITENKQAVKILDVEPESKEKHPYFLKGNWVKVNTLDGRTGYVLDVYLLALPCNNNDVHGFEKIRSVLPDMTTSTVYYKPDVGRLDLIHRGKSIEVIEQRGDGWEGFIIALQGWTMEEAVVFFDFFMKINRPDFDNRIYRNWENEMDFTFDDGICEVSIKDQKTKIVISGTCRC